MKRARPALAALALTVGSALVLTLAVGQEACAKTPPAATPGYSVTVSPVRFDLRGEPGRTVETTVQVTNSSSAPVVLRAEAVDFTAEDEQGKPNFAPSSRSPWSMSGWISAEPDSFKLKPGEQRTVNVRIAVPKNAEPGGHYAAALFSSAPVEGAQTAVVAKVGTLLLMTVSGDIRESGSAALLGRRLYEHGPVVVETRFTNQGNVHVKPTGTLYISRLWGPPLAELPVGDENVLPQSSRVFQNSWDGASPGIYVTRSSLTFGGSGSNIAETPPRYVFVLPWKLVLAAFGIFALGVVSSLLVRRKKAA